MEGQPKTGASLFEPYLAMVQASPSGTPGSWNARWAELTLARQAAVIVAARAAANDECG
jgi:Putative lipoprotein LpqV